MDQKETLEHMFVDEEILKYFTTDDIQPISALKNLRRNQCKVDLSENRRMTVTPVGLKSYKDTLERLINDHDVPDEEEGVTKLHIAAGTGNVAELKSLVALTTESVNARTTKKGFTPLHYAVFNHHLNSINILLSEKADPNICVDDCYSPLVTACELGYIDAVRLLVNAGGSIGITPFDTGVLLEVAARSGNAYLVKYLISIGLKVTSTFCNGVIPLAYAVENGHVEIVKILLAERSLVNAEFISLDIAHKRVYRRTTVLHLAAQNGYEEIVKLLISAGASVTSQTNNLFQPIHLCAQNGHVEIIKELISHGASVICGDSEMITPLHFAAVEGHVSTAELLLENGANVNALARHKVSPLHIAAVFGHTELIQMMIDKYNANVHQTNEDNQSVLVHAIFNGNVNLLELLLKEGADPNVLDNEGHTLMDYAAGFNINADCMRLLLDYNSIFHLVDDSSWCMLHCAAFLGSSNLIQVLLERGANVNAITNNGRTPLQIAVRKNHLFSCKVLIEKGADVAVVGEHKLSLLHVATHCGYRDVVKELLVCSTVVDAKMNFDITPLHFAAAFNHVSIAKLLINGGADVNAVFTGNVTCLHLATGIFSYSMVKLLLKKGAYIDVLGGKRPQVRPFQLSRVDISDVNDLLLVNLNFLQSINNGARIKIKSHLEEGALINVRSCSCGTALIAAAQNGLLHFVMRLLKNKADMLVRDIHGRMAIHYAAFHNNYAVVLCLLGRGCPFDPRDNENNTPVILAEMAGQDNVAVLLEKITNYFEYSEEGKEEKLSELLELEEPLQTDLINALKETTNNEGHKLVFHAISCGHEEFARKFISMTRK